MTTGVSETWLLRVPDVFADWHGAIKDDLGGAWVRELGREYHLVKFSEGFPQSDAAKFISWRLPVGHAWPCNPRKQEGFIEKAARALAEKFGDMEMQSMMVGALDPGDRYFRTLASNLRGRTLQLLDDKVGKVRDAGGQSPHQQGMFVLVGREGLFAGMSSPADAGGFHPGGTRFIRQTGSISRAGAKIAEALHGLPLCGVDIREGGHWLELGASPGGMTAELLDRGFRVTAVDRAPLDRRLAGHEKLRIVQADAGEFRPPVGTEYDAILSDMNGDAVLAFSHVRRLARWLKPGGVVVFTLKLAGVDGYDAVHALEQQIAGVAASAGMARRMCRHLTYNRLEFTCVYSMSTERV